MNDLDDAYTADDIAKALNQLVSVLSGRGYATATNHLSHDPWQRIEAIEQMALQELTEAAQDGDTKALNQAQRKVQSLSSLFTIADALLKGWRSGGAYVLPAELQIKD